ncbi:RHS repeat-associated core domain-containing protein [Pseudoalteromonas luteoviolacea]|uniref:RHS repeat domain-containing protein n=1 Tax=Pseudoalteromonas luteoviolacea TaxID=43657 RepID=UPI001B35AEDB|nr:RHS repeat-associated core domain-containing protein [Pseudoalteromonas luteoviolacea]
MLNNIEQQTLGNGVVDKTYYSSVTGQMTGHYTQRYGHNLLGIEYNGYDGFGNLKSMEVISGNVGLQHSYQETYHYDDLHRLKSNAIAGITTISYDYDAMGNLLKKSDYASKYDYDTSMSGHTGGGPNAVKRVFKQGQWVGFSYDARGNMTKGGGLVSAQYNALDKPTTITKNGMTSEFVYGPDHMRFMQVTGDTTTYYAGKHYELEIENGEVTQRAFIEGVALVSKTDDYQAQIRYMHKDRLGSARVMTNRYGNVIVERNFDPFGKPRSASGGLKFSARLDDKGKARTNRGFTDHEHLDELELIHMNGRVYDYNLGRFMSVDPVIQSPKNSQSINPYSYIMNNPLAGTDPTGYCMAETGTRIKSCGDMKVDVKVDGNVVGSAVVKDVNFRSSASVNGALNQGASMVSNAFSLSSSAADIGSPANTNATTQPNNGSSTLSNIGDTINGVAKAGANSLRKGGGIGLALTPMETATDEQMEDLAAPVIAENKAKAEEKQTALLTQLRTRVDKDGYITSYKAPTKEQLVKIMAMAKRGFSPDEFPNLGAFFTLDPNVAGGYANARGAGVLEVKTSFKIMESLIKNGHLSYDPLERSSFSVYPQGLPRFNSGSQIRHIQPNSYELYDVFNAQ